MTVGRSYPDAKQIAKRIVVSRGLERVRLQIAISVILICSISACSVFKADRRLAFLGDSLTQGWSYPSVNFGHYGDTTAQILDRAPAVIVPGRYARVIVLGGTNDVLQRINPDTSVKNLEKIAMMVHQAGAEPVLCEIPPVFHSLDAADPTDFSGAVQELNKGIVALGRRHGWTVLDYYHPLIPHPAFFSDGVHLKRRGYLVMEATLIGAKVSP